MVIQNTVLHYFTLYIALFVECSLNMGMSMSKLLKIVRMKSSGSIGLNRLNRVHETPIHKN
jgi:hypothetical protein